jgi:spermidine synthase
MSRRAPEVPAHGSARLVPDPGRTQAWTLLVDGVPQSHVNLDDPLDLEFEYVRRLAHLADLAWPPGPLNVLHLGGGAWTLARYLAAARPGSRQRVVEIDGGLVEFVRAHLPSPAGVRVRVGEARDVLTGLRDDSVDLIVLDVFAGATTPAHLTSTGFVTEVARVLRPDGVYAANLADGDRLRFARSQVATAATSFGELALVAEPAVLRGRRFGNLVLAAAHRPLPLATLSRRVAADPFPARIVDGEDLARLAAGVAAVTDGTAVDSPAPPENLFG